MNIMFDHTNHKKLWNWLAENPEMEKEDWPEWEDNGGSVLWVFYHCFACGYAKLECSACPLIWPSGRCLTDNGIYEKWANKCAEDPETRKELARQIANLSVKKGIKIK